MEPFKLTTSTAAALIRRLGEHLERDISIMDRDGIIIASSDPESIGIFHRIAYRIITTGTAMESVAPGDDKPPGVKPGVSLPLAYQGEIIGIVGVSGEPRDVGPMAYAVKTGIETMIELEHYKEQMVRQQDKRNLFLNYLLYEDDTPRAVIESLAAKLGYKSQVYRAPVLLLLQRGLDADEALAALRRSGVHSEQDISSVTLDGTLVVFKTIPFTGKRILSEYKEAAGQYAAAAAAALGTGGKKPSCRACIGSYQADFTHYRAAYRQALWLAERLPHWPPGVGPVFFLDHVQEYLTNRVPRSELCNIFGATVTLLPPDFVGGLSASIEAFFDCAFSGKEAAARLGVHRNTLTARLERLRELFGADLRRDARARDFLSLLALYLQLPGANPR